MTSPRSALSGLALIALCFAPLDGALAQDAPTATVAGQETPPERLDRIRTILKDRARSRPRIDPPPVGLAPLEVVAPPVDWALAAQLVERAQRLDAARLNATRSVTTGVTAPQPGLRAVNPQRLPLIAPAEVDRVLIPVLAPATAEIAASLRVIGQDDAYTAVATAADGVAVRMSGARKRLVLPPRAAPPDRLRRLKAQTRTLTGLETEYVVTRSDSSTDLSFSKFGVGYVLSLICDDPDDLRCAQDAYIVALAEAMVLLNPDRMGGDQ